MPGRRKARSPLVVIRPRGLYPKKKKKKSPQATLAIAPVGYSSGLRIYPKKFIALMRYKVQFTLAAPTIDSFNNRHFWNMTSPYDPDVTGVGTSASLFDKLNAQYNHYEVLSSKINYKGYLRAGNSMLVGLTSSDDTVVTVGTYTAMINDTDTVTKSIQTELPHVDISKTYTRSKVFQKTKYPDTVGSGIVLPAENHYVSLSSTNYAFGLPPGPIDGIVEIVYKVLWSEQRENPDI